MKKVTDKKWFEYSRPHLEWLNWSTELDAEAYTDNLINRAKQINSDTLLFDWESGGYLVYPGKHAPMDDHTKGVDILRLLEEKTAKAGLKFGVAFLGLNGNTYLSQTFPEWVINISDGKPIPKWHGYNFRSICPNTPAGNYLPSVLEELLDNYVLDSVYIEGLIINECHCEYCKHGFRLKYGREIPNDNPLHDEDYVEFQHYTLGNIYRKMREIIDKKSPDTVLYGASYSAARADNALLGEYLDYTGDERHWGYSGIDPTGAPLDSIDLDLRLISAISRRRVMATQWISKHVDLNYSQRSVIHFKLSCLQILFSGSILQIHTQNGWEIDTKLLEPLKEIYDIAEKLRPYMLNSKRLADIAVLYWPEPKNLKDQLTPSIFGTYRTLREYHIPFEIITQRDIESGILENFKVLILPNAKRLSDEVILQIEKFVNGGGNMIMTAQSGMFTGDGKPRKTSSLEKIAGLKRRWIAAGVSKDRFPTFVYYRMYGSQWGEHENRLLSFRGIDDYKGDYVELECNPDVTILGEIFDLDYSRMHREHIAICAYPGRVLSPMMTQNTYGKGKVITIAAELDTIIGDYEDPQQIDVFAYAIKMLEDGEKLICKCPPSVQVTPFINAKGIAIFLLNSTTNQLTKAPVRYCVPITDIEITIDKKWIGFKPSSITGLSGEKLDYTDINGKLVIKIGILDLCETILIER